MDPFVSTSLREWRLETRHGANGDRHHQLECWRPVRRLGTGAFGDVWQERCLSGPSQNDVRAVKSLSKRQASFSEMSRREIEALTTFSNSNVPEYKIYFVQCLGWFDDTENVYIAMEFLEHGDLQHYITSSPIPEPEAASITTQVAQALQYMHQKNFVHRDIKPLNILVSCPGPHWQVKVADFGIAKNTDGTVLGTLEIGTRGYMAPELFGSSSDPYTAAVDIWALGAVAYCMRAGFPPFRTVKDLLDYARDHRTRFPIRPLSTSSAFCMDFVSGTMAEAPERRLMIEQVLAHEWLSEQVATIQKGEPSITTFGVSPSNSWNTHRIRSTQQSQTRSTTDPEIASPSSPTTIPLQPQANAPEESLEREMGKLTVLEDLVVAHRKQQKYDRAEKIAEEVAHLRQEMLGAKHPETIQAMADLAAMYYEDQKYTQAEKIWKKVVNLRQEVLGVKHPDTIQAIANLAATYYDQRKYDKAESIDRRLWRLRHEVLGSRHPDTIHVMERLGKTYREQQSFEKAEKLHVELAFLRQDMLGIKHPDTIQAIAELATVYLALGRYDQAENKLKELIDLRTAVIGDKHTDTMAAMESLGSTYYVQMKYKEAQEIRREILSLRREASGSSPDDGRFASASYDQRVEIWDATTGKCLLTLTGHRGLVYSVAWPPDNNNQLASASHDKTVKIWDIARGRCTSTLIGHCNPVCSVAWSPNSSQLASASHDKTVKIWDATTGEFLLTLVGHHDSVCSVAWSPDSSRLASASNDKTVKIWDTATGQCVSTLTDHNDSRPKRLSITLGYLVVWSHDGMRLVSALCDSTVKIWDTAIGQCISTLTHQMLIHRVAWSPDNSRLATASLDTTIKVWDATTGQCLLTLTDHNGPVYSVAWSPNGSQLASGCTKIKIWDIDMGKSILNLNGHKDPDMGKSILNLNGHKYPVDLLAWSPNGLLASVSYRTVNIWDTAMGQCIFILKGHSDYILWLAWSFDGNRLATASYDKMVKIWNTTTGKCISTLSGHNDSVFSAGWRPNAGL